MTQIKVSSLTIQGVAAKLSHMELERLKLVSENNENATEADEQVMTDPEGQEATESGSNGDSTFSREYVESLRAENAEQRTKAKRADENLALARNYALRLGSDEFLTSPLEWDDSFNDDETGLPDVEKIREAAESYSLENPAAARVRGDSGSGYRGQESDAFSLLDALRA